MSEAKLYLAIDTSAGASAAVVSADETSGHSPEVVSEFFTADTRSHSEVLAAGIDRVLAEAGLNRASAAQQLAGIFVGVGPGPFTGLRVGIVTAQTLGFAWQLPVHGVLSLDALAFDVAPEAWRIGADEFVAATDARRKEVYWAHYRVTGGEPERLHGPFVTAPAEVTELPVYGAGAGLYPDQLHGMTGFTDALPRAGQLGIFGIRALRRGADLESVEPRYLRGHDAKIPAAMKQHSTGNGK